MNELLKKLIKGKYVKKEDIYDALYEICDNVYSGCNDSCPVYEINGDVVDCLCYKNGKKMYDCIKENS